MRFIGVIDISIEDRKIEHIKIAAQKDIEEGSTLFDEVQLIHNALPDFNFDEVNTSTQLFGKPLSAPFIIGAITGGTELSGKINEIFAEAAEQLGIGMYVGSQRIAIEKPETRWTFSIIKDKAPSALKIANIGAPQISKLDESKAIDWINAAIDMIDASAIAIHLNPAQEVFQPEGEPWFKGVIDKIKHIAKSINKPVIVKEVGNGISKEVAAKLKDSMVSAIDVGGIGGTSFIKIEAERWRRTDISELSSVFNGWGIPTAISICEVKSVFDGVILASGGIRSGLDGVKAIALGASAFTMSRPMLINALNGKDQLMQFAERVVREFKIAMFLTGSKCIGDLPNLPIILGPTIINWLAQRGVRCR